MSSERGETIKRILVALDASPQSLAALEAAAELAKHLEAELAGIFVEDINLVRLAELPGSREVGAHSAAARPLGTAQLERQLRARAERVRHALAMAAERSRLRWSFRVARGAIEAELLAAADQADLVILGRAGWSGRGRLGSTARAILHRAPRRALVLEAGERLRPTLMAVYDGSPTSSRALETAADMAIRRRGKLIVGVLGEDEDLEREAVERMRQLRVAGELHRLQRADSAELAQILRRRHDCMLVLHGESELLQGKSLSEALGGFKCPVLVVR